MCSFCRRPPRSHNAASRLTSTSPWSEICVICQGRQSRLHQRHQCAGAAGSHPGPSSLQPDRCGSAGCGGLESVVVIDVVALAPEARPPVPRWSFGSYIYSWRNLHLRLGAHWDFIMQRKNCGSECYWGRHPDLELHLEHRWPLIA